MNPIIQNENTIENTIEQFLKKQASSVYPSKDLFEGTMNDVTKQEAHRITSQEAVMLSPYQVTSYFFMKKIAYIGIPLAVIALVAVVAVKKNSPSSGTNTKVTYQDTSSSQAKPVAGNTPSTSSSDTSLDDVVDRILADANADASAISSESNEGTSLQAELQEYNNLKTTDYENSI